VSAPCREGSHVQYGVGISAILDLGNRLCNANEDGDESEAENANKVNSCPSLHLESPYDRNRKRCKYNVGEYVAALEVRQHPLFLFVVVYEPVLKSGNTLHTVIDQQLAVGRSDLSHWAAMGSQKARMDIQLSIM
jgi:hypothetical protein